MHSTDTRTEVITQLSMGIPECHTSPETSRSISSTSLAMKKQLVQIPKHQTLDLETPSLKLQHPQSLRIITLPKVTPFRPRTN